MSLVLRIGTTCCTCGARHRGRRSKRQRRKENRSQVQSALGLQIPSRKQSAKALLALRAFVRTHEARQNPVRFPCHLLRETPQKRSDRTKLTGSGSTLNRNSIE